MFKPRYAIRLIPSVFLAPLLVLFAGLSEGKTAKTKPEPKSEEESIRSVIQQQLDAFNREDYDAAYRLASRHVQAKFSRPEFEQMVKGGYPQIAKSIRATFITISFPDKNRATADMTITGRDRVTITAAYRMVWEDEKWKVDGVMIMDERTPVSYEPA